MPENPSCFVWYDLLTTDPPAALSFYEGVLGWRAQDAGMPDSSYTLFLAEAGAVGGVMPFPAGSTPAQPHWTAFIGVSDVDHHAALVQQRGGALQHGPADIPGVGRFASVTDPGGAAFRLFQPNRSDPPPDIAPWSPGQVGWHELHATDGPAAFRFYTELFGWTPGESIDMGAAGQYLMFTSGSNQGGGVMTKTAAEVRPAWLLYFTVEALDSGAARVAEYGGTVLMGPHQVPGGSWIVVCRDPQGAAFALVSQNR